MTKNRLKKSEEKKVGGRGSAGKKRVGGWLSAGKKNFERGKEKLIWLF